MEVVAKKRGYSLYSQNSQPMQQESIFSKEYNKLLQNSAKFTKPKENIQAGAEIWWLN